MVTKEQAHSAFSEYMDWALANWEGKDTSSYDDRQASADALTVLKFIEQSQLPPAARHDLYTTGDENAPDSIKDRNGEVVLGLCKVCGKAESELSEPCSRAEQSPRVPEKISDYGHPDYGEVWGYYMEGWNDCIDEMLATVPKPGGDQ